MQSGQRTSKYRKRLRNFLALLFGLALLLVCFALVELGFRIVYHASMRAKTQGTATPTQAQRLVVCDHDSLLGWVFPASTQGIFRSGAHPTPIQTNAFGLRNRGIDVTDSTSMRILVLGDSYAFGWGVQENQTYARQLEEMARKRYPHTPIEVVNAGIPGYSIYQQRAMLESLVHKMKIDIVVSSLSLANDAVDEARVRRAIASDFEDYSFEPRDQSTFISRFIRRSYFLSWVNRRTMSLQCHLVNMDKHALSQVQQSLEDLISICQEHESTSYWSLFHAEAKFETRGSN